MSNGTSFVKTRYSFYEAEDPGALGNPVGKKMNSVAESRTMESEETGSTNDNDKTGDAYEVRKIKSARECSDITEETKNMKNTEMEIVGKADAPGMAGKPPIHQHVSDMNDSSSSTNAHEKAIREALVYIRQRGQQRATILENTVTMLDAIRSKSIDEPVSTLVGGLSPVIDGTSALATATKLDNRLLSPPADVRKVASDMFRNAHGDDISDDNRDATKPFEGLELAQPVNSISTPYGRGSPMHTTDRSSEQGMDGDANLPHFSITPSSPAPGKSHGLQWFGHNSILNDSETPEARRQKLELERRTRRELEIEKGVEQVLQSILQRADTCSDSDTGDTIERILSDLFSKQSISPSSSTTGRRTIRSDNTHEGTSGIRGPDASSLSAVEEHFMEHSDEEDTGEVPVTHLNDSTQNDTSIRPINSKEGMLEVEAIKSDNECYFDESHDEMVLGPLSSEMGGTTGVVLQHYENDVYYHGDEDDTQSNHENIDTVQEVLSMPASPSIISSVTSAARRTSKLVAAKLSFSPSNKSMEDKETLVKELYRHILTRHTSHKQEKNAAKKDNSLSKWMLDHFKISSNTRIDLMWDDLDPDEPGYIVHTLSRARLQEIEEAYEDMIDKAGSEYEVAMRGKTSRSHKRLGSDIERDLLDVEKMLEKQKKKANSPVLKKKTDQEEANGLSSKTSNALLTNPNFPGAKAAGTGEVGDLEIYHLPIIYKAHQTGFEPTKDLVLQPDSVFGGQYYVQSELGSAAFSTAYRCVDLNSGKKSDDGEVYYDEVCLKVIKNTKDFFDQSLDEIKILELLRQTGECNDHNILEMKAFFYHKEHLIIVTELLRQNLFEFGKYIMEHDEPKYFTRSRLCYIARQCLVALSFVHKLGLVHSDIKPENILLASYSRARVKVIDFGSSCYLTDRQSSYIQSRSYRAPEVVLGLQYDGKIDIWSLGCVIAEMYSGNVTFQNDSVLSMLARIEAICGAFPRHMIEEGRQNGQFFTPTGLLYEKVESDEESAIRMDTSSSFHDDDEDVAENTLFNVLQPKTTTMAERLGFDPNLLSSKRSTWEEDEKALFTDFITKLLTVDPDKRPTADEALEHPWILSGFNLTEEDLKYPPDE